MLVGRLGADPEIKQTKSGDKFANLSLATNKKFKTKDIVMTYGTTDEGKMPLNKLNEMIAKEMNVKVSELAVEDDTPPAQAKKTTAKKTDAKETAAKK